MCPMTVLELLLSSPKRGPKMKHVLVQPSRLHYTLVVEARTTITHLLRRDGDGDSERASLIRLIDR